MHRHFAWFAKPHCSIPVAPSVFGVEQSAPQMLVHPPLSMPAIMSTPAATNGSQVRLGRTPQTFKLATTGAIYKNSLYCFAALETNTAISPGALQDGCCLVTAARTRRLAGWLRHVLPQHGSVSKAARICQKRSRAGERCCYISLHVLFRHG